MGRHATNTHYNVLSFQGRQSRAYRPHFAAKETEAEKGEKPNKNDTGSKGLSQSLNQFLFVSTSSLSLKTSIQQHSLGINLELATFLFTHQEPGPAGPPDSLGKASKPGDSGNASLLCLHRTQPHP